MKLYVLALPILMGISFAWASNPQNGQADATKPDVKVSETPVLPPLTKLKIREEQHKIDGLQLQFDQYQQGLQNLQKQYTSEQEALNALVEEAYKSAKADKKDFNLDLEKLEFKPIKVADPVAPKPQG